MKTYSFMVMDQNRARSIGDYLVCCKTIMTAYYKREKWFFSADLTEEQLSIVKQMQGTLSEIDKVIKHDLEY